MIRIKKSLDRRLCFTHRAEHQPPSAHPEVGPKENSISEAGEDLAELRWRMSTKLGDARGDVDVEVWIAGERFAHSLDVFRVVRKVNPDEYCLWVPRDHPIPRREDCLGSKA